MNTLIAFCLSLLIAMAFGETKPKICAKKQSACDSVTKNTLNVTCIVSVKCVDDVLEGKADIALASANDMVANVDKVSIMLAEDYGVPGGSVRYYGVAVVKKDSTLTLKNLKGKKSCHTGAGRTAGWVIPVGYLLKTKEMTYVKNQYESASKFFTAGSCVPGVKSKTEDAAVIKDLCKLCKNPSVCSGSDAYAGYSGAFKCMADGSGEVAFVNHGTADYVIKMNASRYGQASDYRLLCKDGTKKAITEYQTCNVDRRPASALVVAITNKGKIDEYRAIFKVANITGLAADGVLSKDTEKLDIYAQDTKKYLGAYYDDKTALTTDNTGGGDTGASSTLAVSFALQILGVLSILLVF